MNAMVTQFDKNVFGEDADEFRPERWLGSEEHYWAMEKAMLVFGAGTRTCIGKNVRSILRTYALLKTNVIVAFVRRDVQSGSGDPSVVHHRDGP